MSKSEEKEFYMKYFAYSYPGHEHYRDHSYAQIHKVFWEPVVKVLTKNGYQLVDHVRCEYDGKFTFAKDGDWEKNGLVILRQLQSRDHLDVTLPSSPYVPSISEEELNDIFVLFESAKIELIKPIRDREEIEDPPMVRSRPNPVTVRIASSGEWIAQDY